jgi:thioredoxin-related protein
MMQYRAMNKKYWILATLLLFSVPLLVSAEMLKCAEKDWVKTSLIAQKSQVPILILFTADACPYCERLKQDVLEPMFDSDVSNRLAVVREIDINSGGKMTDFNGERIRSRQFKDRYQVFATPTLLILDQSGKPLAEPIVGYNSMTEYRALLKSQLQDYRLAHQ